MNNFRHAAKDIFHAMSPSLYTRMQCHRTYRRLMRMQKRRGNNPGESAGEDYKRVLVRYYALKKGINVLVETGTYRGEMLALTKDLFRELHSIEVFENLYAAAKKRFTHDKNIKLHNGDSGQLLPAIFENVKEPAVVWLDAHYSGAGTGKTDVDTPIMKELDAVAAHPYPSVVLIDDARDFTGSDDYPTIGAVYDRLSHFRCINHFEVANDIIRIELGPVKPSQRK